MWSVRLRARADTSKQKTDVSQIPAVSTDPLGLLSEIDAGWHVDFFAVRRGVCIGSGAFGKVHSCTVSDWPAEGENSDNPFVSSRSACPELVAKRVVPSRLKSSDASMLRNEVKLWSQLNHVNIVRFVGLACKPRECLLLSEFCEGGTLEQARTLALQRRLPPPTEEVALDQMRQIASAMAHVNAVGYMHRDLKPANILVHASWLKVADFGLARTLPDMKRRLTAETGSYRFMAPEVMRHEAYDGSCDVYSYAMVAWQLLTSELPFSSLTPVEAAFAVADKLARPPVPPSCSAETAALLEACWHATPERRPSFEGIVHSIDAMGPSPRGHTAGEYLRTPPPTLSGTTIERSISDVHSVASDVSTSTFLSVADLSEADNLPATGMPRGQAVMADDAVTQNAVPAGSKSVTGGCRALPDAGVADGGLILFDFAQRGERSSSDDSVRDSVVSEGRSSPKRALDTEGSLPRDHAKRSSSPKEGRPGERRRRAPSHELSSISRPFETLLSVRLH